MTKTQMFVLRRMVSGTRYEFRGDRGHGREVRHDIATRERCDVNCRSLAPLMRNGWIEFECHPTDMTRYYRVIPTKRGYSILRNPEQVKP